MYGIPNFKLEKWIIERRLDQMRKEGVIFETEVTVGSDISAHYLAQRFDAIVLATGTPVPRDLPVPGRSAQGIHFALDFLTQQTNVVLGYPPPEDQLINPQGKHVVVIGGGDTGSDCVGSVLRRGCASVTQLELLPKPSPKRQPDNPWPQWPKILRTSSSHQEGGERLWSIKTTRFMEKNQILTGVLCTRIAWKDGTYTEIPGTESIINADLVLLSMGFLPHNFTTLFKDFSQRASTQESHMTVEESVLNQKVFIAGDAAMGASLVVHAINSGRVCAEKVNNFLNAK
jgi:NADPH-dependent glutamate synthase beta subunit-like oxidoreductase